MNKFLVIFLGLLYVWKASGQNDGRYRAPTTRRPFYNLNSGRFDPRYRPSSDGRYVPLNYPETPRPTPIIATTRRPPIDLTPRPVRPSVQGRGTAQGGGQWKIIRDVNLVDPDGYSYLYETENGILAEEQGRIQPLDRGEEALRSTGYYEYTGDDGLQYRVDYVADNNGFVPQGDHIPTPPPHVPKLLAYLAAYGPTARNN